MIDNTIEDNIVYVLSSCNEWKSYSSMKIIGIYSCPETLYDRIINEVENDNMEYDGELPEDPGEFDENLLVYGHVAPFKLDT